MTLSDDPRELPAKIVGIDELTDLAVVKIEATGAAPLPWGYSSRLRVAEWVLAVGNPFTFSQTVTLGIVSNVNRHDPQLHTYNDFIQTELRYDHGSGFWMAPGFDIVPKGYFVNSQNDARNDPYTGGRITDAATPDSRRLWP